MELKLKSHKDSSIFLQRPNLSFRLRGKTPQNKEEKH